MKCSENSLKLSSPTAMLCLQDVSDPGTLHLVEVAVGENMSLKKMTIQPIDEQADIGADHSRGNHSIQDVSIQRSSSVVQNLRKERDFI